MLEYEKIDISEGIDVNKSSNSGECSLCHHWYFIDKNFNYQKYLCNGCKNLAIIYSKGNAYRVNFVFMTINDATKLINSSNLNLNNLNNKVL